MSQGRLLPFLGFSLCLFFLVSCKDLYTQDLSKIFKDGRIPKQLQILQTQMREIPLKVKEAIVERVNNDKQRTDLLRVAVIDSGVDLAHPDLVDQIEYQVKDGQIVGAGRDIMGNTSFASQVLIDPTLFAFGAKTAKDGEITGAKESPLAFINEINSYFVERVLSEVAADPILKASFFNRLNSKNFTVFGFYDFILNPNRTRETYKRELKEGSILSVNVKIDKDTPASIKRLYREANPEWHYQEEENRPVSSISSLEHFDIFFEVLLKAYAEADAKYAISRNILQMEYFSNAEKPISELDPLMDAITVLNKAMSFVLFGYRFYDPIEQLREYIRKDGRYVAPTLTESFAKVAEAVRKAVAELEKDQKTNKSTLNTMKQSLRQLEVLANVGKYMDSLVADPEKHKEYTSALRRNFYRGQHPYISEKTLENVHATHVAGTIAKQNPRIRIFPIRPTTEMVRQTKSDKEALINRYFAGFQEWLKTEMGQELKKEVQQEYKYSSLSDTMIVKQLKKYLKEHTLNAQFIEDVLIAADVAGEKELKLANVSLGTVFTKDHKLTERLPSLTEDLFAEYARFIMGDRIQKNAPHTLFLVATGNDNAWVDGVSRTSFPVGFTSLRALKITMQKKLVAPPNNQIRNILAVGSISRGQTLTEFTNVLIDPNTPQIFSLGEDVLAPTPAKADKISEGLAKDGLIKLSGFMANLANLEFDAKNRNDAQIEDDLVLAVRGTLPDGMQRLSKLIGKILQTTNPITRQRLSGTSMATPTATGIIADYILLKQDQMKLKSSEILRHPAFEPQVLIEEVLELARKEASSLGRIIPVDMLLKSIEEWKTSRAEGQSRKFLKSLNQTPKTMRSCNLIF